MIRKIASTISVFACLLGQLTALKILVAGEFENDKRVWFNSVVQRLAETKSDPDRVIYFLDSDLGEREEVPLGDKVIRYGIGQRNNFWWDLENQSEEENTKRLDLETARAYFQSESLIQGLKAQKFDIGIGGLNYADTLLFRKLDLKYVKLAAEDVEGYTMQRRLNMPVLSSSYPSKQVWSYFDHSDIAGLTSLTYRYASFKNYAFNLWENYQMRGEMRAIVGSANAGLIDDWDQEHALVIGQGANAGLFQSVMAKPLNVQYVYPLTVERAPIEVPDYLRDRKGLVIFNIEANREDDIMRRQDQMTSLRLLLGEATGKNLGIVIMCPPKEARHLEERFQDDVGRLIWIVETKEPHSLKIVNSANPDQLYVWISTCSQDNILSAIGEHKAIMFGYAAGQLSTRLSTQKFNCHKINEFVVGSSSMVEGQVNTISTDLLLKLLDPSQLVSAEVRQRVEFYHEVLQTEAAHGLDLDYWLDFVVVNGIQGAIPNYDKMSTIKYLNLEVYAIAAIAFYVVFTILKSVLGLCGLCKESEKKATEEEQKKKTE